MERTGFNKCLNLENKYFNLSVWGLVVGSICGITAMMIENLIWGVGIGVGGFYLGSYLGEEWHKGNIQRMVYWHLPFGHLLISFETPPSHERNLF